MTVEIISVTIPHKEYKQLRDDQNILRALEAAGVDNWEGYEAALDNIEGD
jgi:hypothetical protein